MGQDDPITGKQVDVDAVLKNNLSELEHLLGCYQRRGWHSEASHVMGAIDRIRTGKNRLPSNEMPEVESPGISENSESAL